jgi:hypothetical protein
LTPERNQDAVLAYAGAEQMGVDATVTKGIDHVASPELIHANKWRSFRKGR